MKKRKNLEVEIYITVLLSSILLFMIILLININGITTKVQISDAFIYGDVYNYEHFDEDYGYMMIKNKKYIFHTDRTNYYYKIYSINDLDIYAPWSYSIEAIVNFYDEYIIFILKSEKFEIDMYVYDLDLNLVNRFNGLNYQSGDLLIEKEYIQLKRHSLDIKKDYGEDYDKPQKYIFYVENGEFKYDISDIT